MDYIYKDFTLTRTSKNAAGEFIQALVISGGIITSMFTLTNGFSEKQVTYMSSFYRLKFRSQENLDKFHSLGFVTTEPPHVHLNQLSLV